jgi:sulfur-oxidizing protein SoxY
MNTKPSSAKRRQLLAAGVGLGTSLLVRPVSATPEELAAALRAYTGGAPLQAGRVQLDIAPLVDNGSTVPVTLSVDSPMTAADHVKAIALFNERNPQREVVKFGLGPRAGRAVVSTRIRLATSQKLVAVAALSDGSHWSHTVEVIVTIAACLEGEV